MKKVIFKFLLIVSLISNFGGISYSTESNPNQNNNIEDYATRQARMSQNQNNNQNNQCIELNTDLPINGVQEVDGKKCLKPEDADKAFGSLMGSLMKLAINFTIAIAFIALIASGIMLMVSGASQSTAGKGKELLKKVVLGIVLLGLSGVILHTINPNFFTTGNSILYLSKYLEK